MQPQPQPTLIAYIEQSLRENWEREAFCNHEGAIFLYKDVARKISKLHLLLHSAGIRPGEKIAICGRNSAGWSTAFLAIITYGCVAVPILNDFKPDTIHHLVCDSDAKLLFTTDDQWHNLDGDNMPALRGIIRIDDFDIILSRSNRLEKARASLNRLFGDKYPERFTPKDVSYRKASPQDIVLINYTSGSSGFSKGVMLTWRNLWSNIQFCIDGLTFLHPGDGMVSMLPLAHMYGLVIEMLHPFIKGCHIHFLSRTPSPRIIMEAFSYVRPKLVITVPLILEKIVRTKVFPVIRKPMMRLMLHTPSLRKRILEKIRRQLINAFGGELREVIIGGAAMSADVETLLRLIHFPFTVGYGMTECAPLIAYEPWKTQRPGSCGRITDRMEARILSDDPVNKPGVLLVKGDNVMAGYYRNTKATGEAFMDGWLVTGDVCTIDADGFIYIRGRDKNMILGPSGQNIYPEEIEQRLNAMPYVQESLIIDDGDGKLAALVYPQMDRVVTEGLDTKVLETIMNDNIARLNKDLPAYSQVRRLKLMPQEFEKTPKRSIRRYLYAK